MSLFLKCVVFILITGKMLVVSGAPMMSSTQMMAYFKRYGYVGPKSPLMSQGISNFQKLMHMKPTGSMDWETNEIMHKPRCGVPDMRNNKPLKSARWENKNEFTFKILNDANATRSKVSPAMVNKAIHDALQMWSDVTNVDFIRIKGDDVADIEISFRTGNHLANHNEFDGPTPEGMELAHAGPPNHPNEKLRGDIHFDDDETWVLNPDQRSYTGTEFNLLYVAVHEIGHSLGLSHQENKPAIMGMMYKNTTEVMLQDNDIERIRKLYGKRSTGRLLSRIDNAPNLCVDPSIDAALSTEDGSAYLIKGDYFWKLSEAGLAKNFYPKVVGEMWENAPANIDAAFTRVDTGHTFLFKDSKVWRYKGRKFDWSDTITGRFKIPVSNVDAVLKGGVGQPAYFFKGNMYFMRKADSTVSQGLIARTFKGVPDNLNAAVMYKRKGNPSDPVFFKGGRYYHRRFQVAAGKVGQYTDEYVEADSKKLFGCPQ